MTALALTPNGVKRPMLSNVFEEWIGNDFMKNNAVMLPKTNITENDDHYLIELSVPGYQKNDLEIKVDRKLLTVSHSNENSQDLNKNGYLVREFSKQAFSKSYGLSDSVDTSKISAKCVDGVLSITLPKREEAKSKPPRNIDIK